MAKEKTSAWDPAEYLDTDEKMAAYLEAALEAGEPGLVEVAIDDIARANVIDRKPMTD